MKTKGIAKRLVVTLSIVVLVVTGANAQGGNLEQFQKVVMEYQNRYQSAVWSGKHMDAIEPLKTLINLLDTTTIYVGTHIPKGALNQQKGGSSQWTLSTTTGSVTPPPTQMFPGQNHKNLNQEMHIR